MTNDCSFGILSHNVEGILWVRSRFSRGDIPAPVSIRNVPGFCVNVRAPDRRGVSLSYEELGLYAGRKNERPFRTKARFDGPDSIAAPRENTRKRFVVVGTANMDTLISVSKQLEPGETVPVRCRTIIPGGKSLNQAVAIAKLGEDVSLIAALGCDPEGSLIYDCLKANAVNSRGVRMHDGIPTGHAYIYVQEDAESSISVYAGANDVLCEQDILENEALFRDAEYCLLQTEINQSIVLCAAKTARKHRAKVILKPCAISRIDPELLRHVDILVPNRKEACKLLPHLASVEEQAEWFREHGAGGLATMRYGVPPALVNKDDLETFYSTHANELEERKA